MLRYAFDDDNKNVTYIFQLQNARKFDLTWVSSSVISGVRVTRSFILCVYFVDRCLAFYPFSFGVCFPSFFDLRILITPLVSSNSLYHWIVIYRSGVGTAYPSGPLQVIPIFNGVHFTISVGLAFWIAICELWVVSLSFFIGHLSCFKLSFLADP